MTTTDLELKLLGYHELNPPTMSETINVFCESLEWQIRFTMYLIFFSYVMANLILPRAKLGVEGTFLDILAPLLEYAKGFFETVMIMGSLFAMFYIHYYHDLSVGYWVMDGVIVGLYALILLPKIVGYFRRGKNRGFVGRVKKKYDKFREVAEYEKE